MNQTLESEKLTNLDREIAILIFGDKIYTDDCNHQYALQKCLKDKGIEIDPEDYEQCRNVEKKYWMCPISYFTNGRDYNFFLIHEIDKYTKIGEKLLKEYIEKENFYKPIIAYDNYDGTYTVISYNRKEIG